MPIKQKPAHVIRIGLIKAAIWANATEKNGIRHSVTVTRLYKKDGEWRDSASFGQDELLLVRKVLDQAHSWMYQQPRTA